MTTSAAIFFFFNPVSSRRSTTSPDTSGNFPPPHFSSVCVNLSLLVTVYTTQCRLSYLQTGITAFFSPVTCYITALFFFDWPWVFLKSDFSSFFYLFIPAEEKNTNFLKTLKDKIVFLYFEIFSKVRINSFFFNVFFCVFF